MVQAIKRIVTIQSGGRVEVTAEELPAGREAEVIVLVRQDDGPRRYLPLFGCGRGGFGSPQQADTFLSRERDSWE